MSKEGLVKALKTHLSDVKEEESAAKEAGNDAYQQGLQYARINLETILEQYGISRTVTLDNAVQETELIAL